jgi:hypothetical protein
VPGFLAIPEPIPEPQWSQMKSDIKAQYGGTKRSLMMLQNVGKGGIEWVSTALSQKDMEFLAARTFNREEIFAIFAPGLSSVLAVNATEANAQSGKSTLLEFAIWPDHVAVAEKITNDVLPAYGQSLVAEFEDVRHTDEALELKKIEAYERSHSINEVRRKFYDDDPLEDPRGELLVAEIGSGPTDTRDPEAKQAAEADRAADTDPTPTPGPELPRSGKALDLDPGQRKALKRLKSGKPAVCDFASDELLAGEIDVITASLKTVATPQEVNALFAALHTALQTASTHE